MSRVTQRIPWFGDVEHWPSADFTRSGTFPNPVAAGSGIVAFVASFGAGTDPGSGKCQAAYYNNTRMAELMSVPRASKDDLRIQVFSLMGAAAGTGTLRLEFNGTINAGNPKNCQATAFEVPGLIMAVAGGSNSGADGIANSPVGPTAASEASSNMSFAFLVNWVNQPATLASPWEAELSRSNSAGAMTVSIYSRETSNGNPVSAQFTHAASEYGTAGGIVMFSTKAAAGQTTDDALVTFYVENGAVGEKNCRGGVFVNDESLSFGAKLFDFDGAGFDDQAIDGKARMRIPVPSTAIGSVSNGQIVRGTIYQAGNTGRGVVGPITGEVTKTVTTQNPGGGSTTTPTPTAPVLIEMTANGYQNNSAEFRRMWGPAAVGVIDTLWNLDLNASDRRASYRIRSLFSAHLSTCRIYWSDGSGYAGGNGGVIKVDVLPDNGSGLPNESASPLATFTRIPGNLSMSGGTYGNGDHRFSPDVFTSNTALQAGSLYHIVGSNIGSSPGTNWSSFDGQSVLKANGLPVPFGSPMDFAALYKMGGSWQDWTVTGNGSGNNSRTIPVMQLTFAGGGVQGNFNLETANVDLPLADRMLRVGAANPIREWFVPNASRTFRGISYRTAKVSGAGRLRIEFHANGQKLDEVFIEDPGNNYTTTSVVKNSMGILPWVRAQTNLPVTFGAGQNCYVLMAAEGTSVWVHCPQRNGREYGGVSPASFTESSAMHYRGGEWKGTYHWNYDTNSSARGYNWPIALHLVP